MMTAVRKQLNLVKEQQQLEPCFMIVEASGNQANLPSDDFDFGHAKMACEAMIPEIRMLATMIAAERHDFEHSSPDVFTEEADWFAARILVLGVQIFHLDVRLFPMLKLANTRAQEFAKKFGLAFNAANLKMSLHSGRPDELLIMEMINKMPEQDLGFIGNSRFIRNNIEVNCNK